MDDELKAQHEYLNSLTDEDRQRMKEPAQSDVWAKLVKKRAAMKWSQWAKVEATKVSGGRYRVRCKREGKLQGYVIRHEGVWHAQLLPGSGSLGLDPQGRFKVNLIKAPLVICESMEQAVRTCLYSNPMAGLLFPGLAGLLFPGVDALGTYR